MAVAPLVKRLFGFLSSRKKASAERKANESRTKATVTSRTLNQKMGEDRRLGRLSLAQSLLGGTPSTTAGGRVNTNTALDPELMAKLGVERKYDFSGTVGEEADPGAGAGSAFLGGLAGDLGQAAGDYASTRDPGAVGGFGGSEFRPQDIPGMGQPFYDPNKDYEIK
jgi:hypothetical protein